MGDARSAHCTSCDLLCDACDSLPNAVDTYVRVVPSSCMHRYVVCPCRRLACIFRPCAGIVCALPTLITRDHMHTHTGNYKIFPQQTVARSDGFVPNDDDDFSGSETPASNFLNTRNNMLPGARRDQLLSRDTHSRIIRCSTAAHRVPRAPTPSASASITCTLKTSILMARSTASARPATSCTP